MQTVPVFQVGDRVRVMNTSDAAKRGIANLTGIVEAKSNDGQYVVLSDDKKKTVKMQGHSLMAHTFKPN